MQAHRSSAERRYFYFFAEFWPTTRFLAAPLSAGADASDIHAAAREHSSESTVNISIPFSRYATHPADASNQLFTGNA
jgi:hypothetical protein